MVWLFDVLAFVLRCGLCLFANVLVRVVCDVLCVVAWFVVWVIVCVCWCVRGVLCVYVVIVSLCGGVW